jgi:hypothetical protein
MDTVSSYFSAERIESLVFIAVSVLALAAAAGCVLVLRKPFFSGLALTLSVVAALQLIVGITIYQRSPQDTVRVQQMLQSSPQRIQSEEVPRMRVVMRNFRIYLVVEVALLLISLVVLTSATHGTFLRGAAIGMAIQAASTAVLDLIAAQRGDAYLSWLLTRA